MLDNNGEMVAISQGMAYDAVDAASSAEDVASWAVSAGMYANADTFGERVIRGAASASMSEYEKAKTASEELLEFTPADATESDAAAAIELATKIVEAAESSVAQAKKAWDAAAKYAPSPSPA